MRIAAGVVLAAAVLLGWSFEAAGQESAPAAVATATVTITHGPFVGHVEPEAVTLWLRTSEPAEVAAELTGPDGARFRAVGKAVAEHDHCAAITIPGLRPSTRYTYRVSSGGVALAAGDGTWVTTAPPADAPARVTLAIGSCANDKTFPKQPIWAAIDKEAPTAVFLIGDTPYIDSTKVDVQRQRYREFFSVDGMGTLLAHTPLYATWDDHDFGRNDTDGRLPGREDSRRVFMEYHANPSFGEVDAGIYTSTRIGPVEVFLLDARYFSGREKSEFDEAKPALLGRAQWAWLRPRLRASTAPVKLLVTGMVWNEAVRPLKTDYWMAYAHERAGMMKFIADERISGVMLVGGDIHRSRALVHPPEETGVSFAIPELISSPLAQNVHEAARVASPYLLHDAGETSICMLLTVDSTETPATVLARWITPDGRELFRYETTAAELAHREHSAPVKE